jgi:hypothetical protein
MFSSCPYCTIYKLGDAETIAACFKELFLDTAINRGARTSFPALVRGDNSKITKVILLLLLIFFCGNPRYMYQYDKSTFSKKKTQK